MLEMPGLANPLPAQSIFCHLKPENLRLDHHYSLLKLRLLHLQWQTFHHSDRLWCIVRKKINEFVNSRKVGHSTVGPHQPPLLFKEGDCDQQLSRYQNIKKQFLYHRKNYIFTPVRIRISDKVNCTNSRIYFPISVTHLEWKMLKSGFISHTTLMSNKKAKYFTIFSLLCTKN